MDLVRFVILYRVLVPRCALPPAAILMAMDRVIDEIILRCAVLAALPFAAFSGAHVALPVRHRGGGLFRRVPA